jgi:tight adherence protein B
MSTFLITVLLLGVFVVVAGAAFLMILSIDQRSDRARLIKERLQVVAHAQQRRPTEELSLLRDELLSEIPALNRLLARSRRISRLQTWLGQSGLKMRPGKFLLTTMAAGAAGAAASSVALQSGLVTPLAAGICGLIPFAWISVVRARRFQKFEEIFPEAIDLLSRSTRAGHSFPTSLEIIGKELPEPVAGEFRKLFEEQKFGLPVRDALLNLAERVPLIDVKFFVTALMLQRETGGNLAEILDKLSYVIRERFKILRQVRVYTAQGRVTLYILMALPPTVMFLMSLVDSDYVKPLFTDSLGHVLLAMAATMQIVGYFLIRRIIRIRV